MTAFKRIAVLLGGRSPERAVSLVSGTACANALRAESFEIQEFDAGADLAERLRAYKPDAAFNALEPDLRAALTVGRPISDAEGAG